MIELRWTWQEQKNDILTGDTKAVIYPTLYPVLQYRYMMNLGDGFGMFSEWEDVPLPPKP